MTNENNLNNAREAIERGIEFQEQDNLEQAAPCYREAIEKIEASETIEDFVIAKTRSIEVQCSSGEINETEANRLLEQIKTGYESLKNIESRPCGECKRRNRDGYCIGRPPCDNTRRCIVCRV